MSKPQHKSHKKMLLTIIIVIVILVVFGSVIWVKHKNTPATANTATSSYPAENNSNNARKESSSPAPTLNNGPTSSTSQNSTTNNSLSNVSLTITRAGVVGNNLQVGTLIDGSTSGTCTLSVSQTGQTTITASDQETTENNSYVCPVFNLPLSKFPNQGSWNVSIVFSNSSGSVTSSWIDNPVSLSSTP
jgi:cytoskeletal protein RodZ